MGRQVRITKSYTTAYPEPIILAKGECVITGEEDLQYPGWIRCMHPSGRSGWVPVNRLILEEEGERAIVREAYSARADGGSRRNVDRIGRRKRMAARKARERGNRLDSLRTYGIEKEEKPPFRRLLHVKTYQDIQDLSADVRKKAVLSDGLSTRGAICLLGFRIPRHRACSN
nr:SH3 domain-containing protein [Saccharibacillus sp. O23]